MNESDLDDVVREFLVESYENLDRLDQDLVVLETSPDSRQTLASIFRTIHTIKGTCGFLGFSRLESVTHVGESLLSRLRDGQLALTPEITSALLALVDAVRGMLHRVEETQDEGEGDYAALIETLTRLQEPVPAAPGAAAGEAEAQEATAAEPPVVEAPAAVHGWAEPAAPPSWAEEPEPVGSDDSSRSGSVSDSTIRVDVSLLDRLMNLVGELVLARNQILQLAVADHDTAFAGTSQRLNLITTELQEGVMKTRMQPIGNVWNKLPRVVRDLALSCGHQVQVEMEGKETELDKTIIEAIKDPLTHLVRNAVDHGIESPEARIAVGKPAQGILSLRAFHEGGQVNIEIADDGQGLDVERIKRKAVTAGLISSDQAARMSDREAHMLIFMPGFSTADQVTNVSGRGVGMDVVKTNIEKIGGTVDVQTTPGAGTTLRIKIPLTLAIIPALVVTCAQQRYAIPQVSLLELVRLDAHADPHNAIEHIHGCPVYRLRGNLLPLVHLADELGLPTEDEAAGVVNIVVLQADDRQFGLVVEHISDTEEIVVKPLGKQVKAITTFAGATIMGDGKVALILDVLGLAQRASVVNELHDRTLAGLGGQVAGRNDEQRTLLVFSTPDDGRMAMPLDLVDRLEEFPPAAIERTGGADVVQYRGDILPLVHLAAVLPERRRQPRHPAAPAEGTRPLQAIVYTPSAAGHQPARPIGLVVDQILDIVQTTLAALQPSTRPGSTGCLVINGRVTELLDPAHLHPPALGAKPPKPKHKAKHPKHAKHEPTAQPAPAPEPAATRGA